MGAPSIGYEEHSTLRRSDVARIQLIEAIALFVNDKFLPALTLAGAAEEIFGKLLLRRSQTPVVKESAQAMAAVRGATGLSVMGGKSDKELIDGWNAARNAVKHLVAPEEESITLNLCDEAYWMIQRALANANRLGVMIDNANEFENWVVVNVST